MRRLALLFVFALGLLGLPEAAANDEVARLFAVGYQDLGMLQRLRKQRNTVNDDLMQYLQIVGSLYRTLEPDRRWRRSMAYRSELKRFRKKAEDEFLACLVLEKRRRYHNVRDPVNATAARVLGDCAPVLAVAARERLSRRIRDAFERRLADRAPRHANEDVGEAVFTALAELGSLDSLRWILDEHVRVDERRVAYLVTAHKSLLRYEGVPGALRYAVVKRFLRTYAPIEMFARQVRDKPGKLDGRGMMARRLWDNLQKVVVHVVQHYASDSRRGAPKARRGRLLSTLAELEVWFRRHKDLKKAPWVDP